LYSRDCLVTEDTILLSFLETWSAEFGSSPTTLPLEQYSWDRPGVLLDEALVESNLSSCTQRANFLAASAAHIGDWMFAFLIASCGLWLDEESMLVVVGLRLGLNICVPHVCRCGALVDARCPHYFVGKCVPADTML